MMIANPTAASAAATTITKRRRLSAERVPLRGAGDERKVHPVQHHSIDMKMVMMLRLIRKPSTPHTRESHQHQIVRRGSSLFRILSGPRATASGDWQHDAPMMATKISTDVTSKGRESRGKKPGNTLRIAPQCADAHRVRCGRAPKQSPGDEQAANRHSDSRSVALGCPCCALLCRR